MLELIFIEGSDRGRVVPLSFEKASFGQQANCDFVLRGDDSSAVHFDIVRRGGSQILIGHESSSGTFVNGVRAVEVALHAGDRISAGTHVMLLRETSGEPTAFRFVAEWPGGAGAVQVFQGNAVNLGRQNTCQIHLNEPAVEAMHAELEHRPDGVWINDVSRLAGVYVNDRRVIRRQLSDGDRVRIAPFEITIRLSAEMCWLSLEHRKAVQPEQAPIWMPTSDVSPNRFRSRALLLTLPAVLGVAGYAVAAGWHGFFVSGPVSKPHGAIECSSCHVGFQGVSQEACQKCHSNVRSERVPAGDRHEHKSLACTSCHSEHRGVGFDIRSNVGSGCQAAGCHVTVHERLSGLKVKTPLAAAFEARFEDFDKNPGDPMHVKHGAVPVDCASCHTNGDAKIKVSRETMRMRCLGCHGFGPQATLRSRCSSCHFEHPTAAGATPVLLRPH